LLIASKYEEILFTFEVRVPIHLLNNSCASRLPFLSLTLTLTPPNFPTERAYTRQQILKSEVKMLKTLEYKVAPLS